LVKLYVENNGGTLRIGKDGRLQYASPEVQNKAIVSPMRGKGTGGMNSFGGF